VEIKSEWIVQLARLALVGRRQDILTYIRKLERLLHKEDPAASAKLTEFLRESPSQAMPLRSASVAAVPVDADSRLNLLRQEWPVMLDSAPTWSEAIRAPLEQVIAERRRADELREMGVAPTRSMLFTGAPGVGKTLAARWLAQQLGWPLLTLDLSAVMSSYLGKTGTNVRHVLDYAKGVQSVLLLDELDAIAKRRDDMGEIGELKRLVTVLLQEIDDWPQTGLLLAATNHPDLLDPAVWRRFDAVVEFPLPDDAVVAQLLRQLLGEELATDDALLAVLTAVMRGQSHAVITRDLMRARRIALVHGQRVEEALMGMVRERVGELRREQRRQVGLALVRMGLSQRQVHEWTGMSRDTLRKVQRKGAVKN
jgi:SpoVK/Ycf46/Vps4 family AAA+-type ATPase